MADTETTWWKDHGALVTFGHVLDAAGWLDTPADALYYVEKPWKFDDVHGRWIAAGQPPADDTDAMSQLAEPEGADT